MQRCEECKRIVTDRDMHIAITTRGKRVEVCERCYFKMLKEYP